MFSDTFLNYSCFNRNLLKTLVQFLLLSIIFSILTACSTTPQRNPLPISLVTQATIPGVPEARFWADEWPTFSEKRLDSLSKTDINTHFSGVYNVPHNYLAISGGGANGAFGAGLLAGWTETGTRPEFVIVTGISTGALTAPFAFLGHEYDAVLKEVYTTTTTDDIAKKRGIISGILSDSMTDTSPLKRMLQKYITADLIEAIAIEHQRGRRLYIGTLNLDAARSVIWDIGAIASSTYPDKINLIHEVLRASAAVPVAFPPIMIPVEVNGKQYDEMHVDGGTGSQVFVYPAEVHWKIITDKLKVKGTPGIYILRNAYLEPNYERVTRGVISIASRSIYSLIRTQGVGDLYQIYALCQRDGNDFNLAYIPSDFDEKPATMGFDPIYMSHLYEYAYNLAIKGYPWQKAPPDYLEQEQ